MSRSARASPGAGAALVIGSMLVLSVPLRRLLKYHDVKFGNGGLALGAVGYGLVVGGKPLFTPLFAFPVSYELTILLSAFATLGGMLLLNRLPKLYNPLFSSEIFKRASNDRFFICIEAADPKFAEARALLEASGASAIELVED